MKLIFISTLLVFVLLMQSNSFAQPGTASLAGGKLVGPTLEIIKVDPVHPVEGQEVKVYFALNNWSTAPLNGFVSGNFLGKPRSSTDTEKQITNLAVKANLSDFLVIKAPKAGSSSGIVLSYYMREFVNNLGARKKILIKAELDVDVSPVYVTKRISGISFFSPDNHDELDGNWAGNGYLLVRHDPGCGWWGNDGTDKFFVKKLLPPGVTIQHPDYVQFWPQNRGCDDQFSWLDDAGSYNADFNKTNNSIRWHNACRGAYGNRSVFYAVSFIISMPEGTDLGEPLFDVKENPPSPPSGFSLSQSKPNCVTATTGGGEKQIPGSTVYSTDASFNPFPLHLNTAFTVSYEITNADSKSSPAFDLTLSVDGTSVGNKTVPILAPGKSTTIQWSLPGFTKDFVHEFDLNSSLGYSLIHDQITVD